MLLNLFSLLSVFSNQYIKIYFILFFFLHLKDFKKYVMSLSISTECLLEISFMSAQFFFNGSVSSFC